MTIAEMDVRLDALNTTACELQAITDTEKRDLTAEEQTQLEETLDEFENLEKQKGQRARLEEQTRRLKNLGEDPDNPPSTRMVPPSTPGAPIGNNGGTVVQRGLIRVTGEGWERDPLLGWRCAGEYLQGVVAAGSRGQAPDERLTRAALSTYGSEGVGAEGGFAVPPAFLDRIVEKVTGEASLFPRIDMLPVSSNALTIPKDEATPWGTAGPQANQTGEAGAITQSKPSLETVTIPLHKIGVLVPLTDELMEDAPALEAYTLRRSSLVIGHKVDLQIYQGTGAGEALGMLNAPATISVAKESSQTADTVNAANIRKIWTRLYGEWRSEAVWLINQDVEPQLMQMYFIDQESTPLSTSPVYLPQGGFSATPFSTLMGRPVIFTQVCETLGDKGDVMLCNLKHYLGLQKSGGIKSTTSIHFWFDQDTTAFKAVMRFGGQPWWSSTVVARDGTTTYSAYVTLAERT